MNQRVTARIVGGKRFTTAEYREYFNASRILRDQANRLGTSRRSFIAAGYELKIHPRATPLLSALTGASPRCTAQDHIELPYRQLLGRCEAHAEALQSMASQLNELSSLIAQTQSLYAQAEEASRKGLNIMLRGLFMSSRESAILALTASALMGVRRSYAKEGKFNKFYLVESTAWMQESFVSVLGEHASRLNIQERPSKDTSILEYITKTLFMVTKPGAAIAEGLSGKGSVNRGLKKIDRLLIPYFDKDHGDNLSVTRVYPKTKVVRGGTSTKDAIADQRRLSEGPLNGERESSLEYGTIACCKYRKADGTYAWRIIIPGTDGNHDSPMDWYTNFELMSADERQRGTAESLRFLDETMKQAGIQPDDPVEIVGHSQGGIIAAAAATHFQDKYDIQHIATLGSPIANFEIPEKTRVTAIEMDDEGIAALDGEANPHTENWLTIRCSVHEEDAPKRAFPGAEVSDSSGEKNSTHYPKYHEAGYRYAYDTGSKSVLDHDRHFQEVVEGELEEVQYYEGRISK